MSEDSENTPNINDYSKSELLIMLDLYNPTNTEIKNKINLIINKPNIKKNQTLTKFFIDAYNKLVNNEQDNEEDDEDEDEDNEDDEDEPQNKQKHDNKDNRDYDENSDSEEETNKKKQPPDYSNNYNINRQITNIKQSYDVPILKGKLNPNYRNIIKRHVIIDSEHRSNILPHDITSGSISNSTNFSLVLDNPLKNIISMKLHSIHIPTSWYSFDSALGNTYFYLDNTYVEIPSGNYNIKDLINTLNTSIYTAVPDLSNFFTYNQNNNKISTTANPGSVVSNIIFYDESNTYQPETKYTSPAKINQNLGWTIGFRVEKDLNGIVYLPVDISHTGQVPVNLFGPKYFTLSIDDYTGNINNNEIVSIGSSDSYISLPSYYSKDLSFITQTCINNKPIVQQSNPRKLTQAQIYSINEIISNQKTNSNRITQSSVNNTLAVIPITENALTNAETQKPYINIDRILGNNIRQYFGPVNIERMKITLYNSNGNIVNLQGSDWSFTLTVEQLYQY